MRCGLPRDHGGFTVTEADAARRQAITLAGEAMAEVIEFWGFKASLGRIWTLLYLTHDPLSADEIAEDLRMSAGAVSMSLAELTQWGLIVRDPMASDRKRRYAAETDLWGVIRRIVRERELRLVGRTVERFASAVEVLEAADAANPGDAKVTFMLGRLRMLLELARTGYRMVEMLAEVGSFTLAPIRGSLPRMFGRS